MGYMQDFEARLRAVLEYAPERAVEKAVKIAKETVVESYRNGIEHGRLLTENGNAPAPRRKPTRGAKR